MLLFLLRFVIVATIAVVVPKGRRTARLFGHSRTAVITGRRTATLSGDRRTAVLS